MGKEELYSINQLCLILAGKSQKIRGTKGVGVSNYYFRMVFQHQDFEDFEEFFRFLQPSNSSESCLESPKEV